MIEKVLDTLENFIIDNLQTYCDKYKTVDVPLVSPTAIYKDVPDFDRNDADTTIYMLPDNFELEYLDIGGDLELTTRVTLYLFVRNNTTEAMSLQTLRFLKSMIEMFKENPQLGEVIQDTTMIDGDIFTDVEGNENIKGYKINLDLIDII